MVAEKVPGMQVALPVCSTNIFKEQDIFDSESKNIFERHNSLVSNSETNLTSAIRELAEDVISATEHISENGAKELFSSEQYRKYGFIRWVLDNKDGTNIRFLFSKNQPVSVYSEKQNSSDVQLYQLCCEGLRKAKNILGDKFSCGDTGMIDFRHNTVIITLSLEVDVIKREPGITKEKRDEILKEILSVFPGSKVFGFMLNKDGFCVDGTIDINVPIMQNI